MSPPPLTCDFFPSQREFILENETTMIDYQEFFATYASKEEVQRITKQQLESLINPAKKDVDINLVIKRIVGALADSTVNLNYALKFIQND